MKKHLFILIVFLHVMAFSTSAKSEEIKLYADLWCPYNCIPNTKYEGYLIDMARAIFEPRGIRIYYNILPWNRTLLLTKLNENVASVGAFIGDGEELVYPENHAGVSRNSFLTLFNNSWRFDGVGSLDKVKLGVIKGYSYGEPIDGYLVENPANVYYLHGNDPLKQAFRMLEEERIDVILDDHNVLQEMIIRTGLLGKVHFAGTVGEGSKTYIAFSPTGGKGQHYSDIFSKGIEELRESGDLEKILSKYGLKDWVKP